MARIVSLRHLLFLILGLLLASPNYAQDPALFPRPAELEPAIRFWVRVYTEVDTQSGFLHDARHLDVIYARLPLDSQQIETTRERIRDDLQVLASGKRTGLTRSQQEVLDLWPANVSDATLAEAATSVRWQLGQSDRFLGGLIRSGAYRAHIEQVINEKNLPPELIVLPHVESSFNPGAYSSASAAGMWQFGRATGQRFMQIDHIVDERMDPYTATYAAMSLLEYNYSILGTWPLALTAYNHGAGGIARAKRELGTDRIEEIIGSYRGRAFGFASRNFYPQFLAVLEVEQNAQRHFGDVAMEAAPEFVEVVTDAYIDAEVFARSIGISLEQLRVDNRALLPIVWDGTKRIPSGFAVKVRRPFATDSSTLLAQIPVDFKFAVQTPDISYVVESGDSLWAIARRFDTTVAKLTSLNQLASSNTLRIGQRLLLPQDNIEVQQLIAGNQTLPVPEDGVYNVRRGDTLSLIAARFNVGESDLLQLNNIADPHRIYPGQQLMLVMSESGVQIGEAASEEASAVPVFDEDSPAVAAAETPEPIVAPQPEAVVPEPPANVAATEVASVEVAPPLPPAAVLPDNQLLEAPITRAQEQAIAVPALVSIEETNEQLVEALSADPSDYSVAGDLTIEIQASETLGHYAEWLDLRSWDIRRLNDMAYREPVIIGDRLKLDFSVVTPEAFEVARRNYHLQQQQAFFDSYRIRDVERYTVAANDSIGSIARIRYSTPIWLLRQYNPSLDFNRIQIGEEVVFPLLEAAE